jgi:hypothetical protein
MEASGLSASGPDHSGSAEKALAAHGIGGCMGLAVGLNFLGPNGCLAPTGIQTQDHSTRILITILITLSQLLLAYGGIMILLRFLNLLKSSGNFMYYPV